MNFQKQPYWFVFGFLVKLFGVGDFSPEQDTTLAEANPTEFKF